MRYDLTHLISWANKPTMRIVTTDQGDEYVLPPHLTYRQEHGKYRSFRLNKAYAPGKVNVHYTELKHTDPQGKVSLYWAYKHAMLDLSKDEQYIAISCEDIHNTDGLQGDKRSFSLFQHYGLPCVRGITLYNYGRNKEYLGVIACDAYARTRAYVSKPSKQSVQAAIAQVIRKMSAQWRECRVIAQEYL